MLKGLKLPASPRLISRNGLPLRWSIVSNDYSVLIEPSKSNVSPFILWLGIVIFIIINAYIATFEAWSQYWFVSAWSVLALAGFAACNYAVRYFETIHVRRGAILCINHDVIELPREGLSWPIHCLKSLDIVVGRTMTNQNRFDKPYSFPTASKQLQIVINDGGEDYAWQVLTETFGWDLLSNRNIDYAANEISKFCGVPINRVIE